MPSGTGQDDDPNGYPAPEAAEAGEDLETGLEASPKPLPFSPDSPVFDNETGLDYFPKFIVKLFNQIWKLCSQNMSKQMMDCLGTNSS